MPFLLSWFEKQIYLKRNYGPGPILDWFAPLAFKSVYAGNKMKIFEILHEKGALTVEELNDVIKGDAGCLVILLDTLVSLGYVKKIKNKYKNSTMTDKWMLESSEINMSEMLDFFDDAFERWKNLDQSIITGKPSAKGNEWFNSHSDRWDNYHANLRIAAKLIAGEVIKHTKIPDGVRKMVDIGGSHGFYSIKFCQKYPELTSVIYDWTEAKKTAVETINQFGMQDRVFFKDGDILTDSPGNGFDMALLFNTIRAFSEDEALIVLKKTHSSLKKGGMLLIADQFCTTLKSNFSKTNALLIVLELINSSKGRPYTSKEVEIMLLKSGFTKPREIFLPRSPGISVLTTFSK
jgi:hypothetical protein